MKLRRLIISTLIIVTASTASCSGNKPESGSSARSQQATPSPNADAPSAAVSPSMSDPPAPTGSPIAEPFKLVIDGRNITANGYPIDNVTCRPAQRGMPGSDHDAMSLSFYSNGHYGVVLYVTNDDPPQAAFVEIDASIPENEEWAWQPQPSVYGSFPLPGDAVVTKSGKTYEVAGNISPTEGVNPQPKGSPVPFEAVLTCP